MNATPIIVGAGALGLLAALFLHRKIADIPSAAEILRAANMNILDWQYEVTGEAFESSKITAAEYSILYEAYVQRFYELWGA